MRPQLETLEDRTLPDAAAAAYFSAVWPQQAQETIQLVAAIQAYALPQVQANLALAVEVSHGAATPAVMAAAQQLFWTEQLIPLAESMLPAVYNQVEASLLAQPAQ